MWLRILPTSLPPDQDASNSNFHPPDGIRMIGDADRPPDPPESGIVFIYGRQHIAESEIVVIYDYTSIVGENDEDGRVTSLDIRCAKIYVKGPDTLTSLQQAVGILVRIAKGRFYEHKRLTDILHRDLNAQNVLINRNLVINPVCDELTALSSSVPLTSLCKLDFENCRRSLEAMPFGALSSLKLWGCDGLTALSSSVPLTSLSKIDVENCRSLKALPDLGMFPVLSSLKLSGCDELTALSSSVPLTSLCKLDVKNCSSLRALPDLEMFGALSSLKVSGCAELTALSSSFPLTSLSKLDVENCSSLRALPDLGMFPALSSLKLSGCAELTALSSRVPLTFLSKIDVENCRSLKALPDLEMFGALSSLKLSGCAELTALSSSVPLTSLCKLNVENCSSLGALPDLGMFPALSSLKLSGCAELTALSSRVPLTFLSKIDVENCRSLRELPDLEMFGALSSLTLSGCDELTALSSSVPLTSLCKLDVKSCSSLRALPDLEMFRALSSLKVSGCAELTALSSSFPLTSLCKLDVENCSSLGALPDLGMFPALSSLKLSGCAELTALSSSVPLSTIYGFYYAKVADFGLSNSYTMSARGTTLFRAPEILQSMVDPDGGRRKANWFAGAWEENVLMENASFLRTSFLKGILQRNSLRAYPEVCRAEWHRTPELQGQASNVANTESTANVKAIADDAARIGRIVNDLSMANVMAMPDDDGTSEHKKMPSVCLDQEPSNGASLTVNSPEEVTGDNFVGRAKRRRYPAWSFREKQTFLELKLEALQVVEGKDWAFISEGLCERCGIARSIRCCENLWSTLRKAYRDITVYESGKDPHWRSNWVSYWKMDEDGRARNKLPRVFCLKWCEMMEKIFHVQAKRSRKRSYRGSPAELSLGFGDVWRNSLGDRLNQQSQGKQPCMTDGAESSNPKTYDDRNRSDAISGEDDLLATPRPLAKESLEDEVPCPSTRHMQESSEDKDDKDPVQQPQALMGEVGHAADFWAESPDLAHVGTEGTNSAMLEEPLDGERVEDGPLINAIVRRRELIRQELLGKSPNQDRGKDSIVAGSKENAELVICTRKRLRSHNWTFDEKCAFLELKEEAVRAVEGKDWNFISEKLLERYGFERSAKCCEDLWGTLRKKYFAILDHDSSTRDSQTSNPLKFWEMDEDERSRNKLPMVFPWEWFNKMERILDAQKKKRSKIKNRGIPMQESFENEDPYLSRQDDDGPNSKGDVLGDDLGAIVSNLEYPGTEGAGGATLKELLEKEHVEDGAVKGAVEAAIDSVFRRLGYKKMLDTAAEESDLMTMLHRRIKQTMENVIEERVMLAPFSKKQPVASDLQAFAREEQEDQQRLQAIAEQRRALDLEEMKIKLQRAGQNQVTRRTSHKQQRRLRGKEHSAEGVISALH